MSPHNPELSWTNITTPDLYGYQVRVIRRQTETSRYFAFSKHGGPDGAFYAANVWRDQAKRRLRANTRRCLHTPPSDHSTGVCGVHYVVSRNSKRDCNYEVYSVSWTDHLHKRRNKTFFVGRPETSPATLRRKAFKAACAFRREWEYCADNDLLNTFDPSAYNDWRDT